MLAPAHAEEPEVFTGAVASTAGTTPALVKSAIEQTFGKDSIMVRVAWCESRYRQFNADGSVYRGQINSHDIGALQINSDYHEEDARKMGINIYTFAGNLKFGKYLYETQGTTPWNWSKPCWGQ